MDVKISTAADIQRYYELSKNSDFFWGELAKNFIWDKPWSSVTSGSFPHAVKWFKQAQLNITVNCLDRHVQTQPNKIAYIWEPNADEKLKTIASNRGHQVLTQSQTYTYAQVLEEVSLIAGALSRQGISKGDVVTIYLPLIPQAIFSMLACARIGAIHNVVFSGFSSVSLANRILDSNSKLLITADGVYRGEKCIDLKSIVDQAVVSCPDVKHVVVIKHTHNTVNWSSKDIWFSDFVANATPHAPVSVDANDPLFVLYTSGSTGKPKGIVHACAGYMVYAQYTFENVFGYSPSDVFWCTADIGWITGHSYVVYGPLLAGASSVIFEGIPTYPDAGICWKIVQKHRLTKFYTAPTAIRMLMTFDSSFVTSYDLSSLNILGSVGEPINSEAWSWYFSVVGRNRCTIVDTWWQTETGGIMISGVNSLTPSKPCYAGKPLPGVSAGIYSESGDLIQVPEVAGLLCIEKPWPGMAKEILGDASAFAHMYFSTVVGKYFSGDQAKYDADGFIRIIGRLDDVLNVSGHRIGTAEVENAINMSANVIESAVVGCKDKIKGEGIYAFVVCQKTVTDFGIIRDSIVRTIETQIGKIARPSLIHFVKELPKTRSGKIMRRILKQIALGETEYGDTSTLLDCSIIDDIVAGSLDTR